MPEFPMTDAEFERRVAGVLSAPVAANPRAKAAIMDRVRLVARPMTSRGALAPGLGRATRHSLVGLAMAAGIGSITTVSALRVADATRRAPAAVASAVVGDSVVEGFRDTLRLVRLMFDDATARRVAVVGDFNAWNGEATRMRRDRRTGLWSTTLALHDGEYRYAIVVDATRWSGDSAAGRLDGTGHVYSLLHVQRVTN